MSCRALMVLTLVVLGVTSMSNQAQAQYYSPGYGTNQGGRYIVPYAPNNYQSPYWRPVAPPRYIRPQVYRQPNPYLPGGSMYSPFNMGQYGSGSRRSGGGGFLDQ